MRLRHLNTALLSAGLCADGNPYCKYNSQPLQWFTSSLFIAGVFAALPAGYTTRYLDRRVSRVKEHIMPVDFQKGVDIGLESSLESFTIESIAVGRRGTCAFSAQRGGEPLQHLSVMVGPTAGTPEVHQTISCMQALQRHCYHTDFQK